MADESQFNLGDLAVPFALGAASLAGGFGAGRNPGVDNPGATYLQMMQIPSLYEGMLQKKALAKHQEDMALYYQNLAAHQLAQEARQAEELKLKQQDLLLKQQEAERERQSYNMVMGLMGGQPPQGQPAAGGLPPTTARGPASLPTAPTAQAPTQPLPQVRGGMSAIGGLQYQPSFGITGGKPTMKLEPTQSSLWEQQADALARDAVKDIADPQQQQTTYQKVRDENLKVLSGLQSKTPSPFEQTQQQNTRALTFVKEFTDQSKLYLQSQAAFDRVREAYGSEHTATSDIALTYAFSKMMDPETGVRDAERETLSAGQALLQRAQMFMPKLESGQSFTPEFRKQIFAMGERMYLGSLNRYAATVERPYQIMAKKLQLDPSVLPDYKGQDSAYLKGKRPAWTPPLPSIVHPSEEMKPPSVRPRYEGTPDGGVMRQHRG